MRLWTGTGNFDLSWIFQRSLLDGLSYWYGKRRNLVDMYVLVPVKMYGYELLRTSGTLSLLFLASSFYWIPLRTLIQCPIYNGVRRSCLVQHTEY